MMKKETLQISWNWPEKAGMGESKMPEKNHLAGSATGTEIDKKHFLQHLKKTHKTIKALQQHSWILSEEEPYLKIPPLTQLKWK